MQDKSGATTAVRGENAEGTPASQPVSSKLSIAPKAGSPLEGSRKQKRQIKSTQQI